jgi:tRNA U55 pseudouridine synthase TruB
MVYALDLVSYRDGIARVELHVSSGTYVRAIAIAIGGHCRTLRRTAVGPFEVDEAASEPTANSLMPARVALDRLPAEAMARVPERVLESVLAVGAGAS